MNFYRAHFSVSWYPRALIAQLFLFFLQSCFPIAEEVMQTVIIYSNVIYVITIATYKNMVWCNKQMQWDIYYSVSNGNLHKYCHMCHHSVIVCWIICLSVLSVFIILVIASGFIPIMPDDRTAYVAYIPFVWKVTDNAIVRSWSN